MSTRSALAARLGAVEGFEDPRADLEQYRTPADLAATLVHEADLRGDVEGRTVVDLGAGTGMLALAAALRGPARVVAVEVDPAALERARENRERVGTPTVEWVRADARRAPLRSDPDRPTTVVTNPPFGAQSASDGDRGFLATAADLADVSYSVHNAGSRAFVEGFVADNGGTVTHAYEAAIALDRQFDFHEADEREVGVEAYRVEWA